MNPIALKDTIMTLDDEFRGTPLSYDNKRLMLNKLNYLKEAILNKYESKLSLVDNSLNFLDNIKYMNNGMRDEVITLCESLIYVDELINKIDTISNGRNQNI